MTSQPTNESELQLYRVLQHANLLSYYDTFISQGQCESYFLVKTYKFTRVYIDVETVFSTL